MKHYKGYKLFKRATPTLIELNESPERSSSYKASVDSDTDSSLYENCKILVGYVCFLK